MGYLEQSDQIVRNVSNQLDQILQSQTSMFLTGLGEAVLVDWWNINDVLSTADTGTGTVDAIIGKDSPTKYNKVEGLPVYNIVKGLQELEMRLDDNGILDTEVEIEAVLIANTIIPSALDHMTYTFRSGRTVTFRANDVKITTVRSNGVYRVPMHLVDIDSKEYENELEVNTVRTNRVILDNIGTNEKCIVLDTIYDTLGEIDQICRQVVSNYIDTFFIRKYNAFAFRGFANRYNVYDPYLTKFIINHDILDDYDELLQPVTMEQSKNFRSEYNKTIYRAVELRDKDKIKLISYDLGAFSKKLTNPFDYYGEEQFYYLSVYKDKEIKYPRSIYMDYDFLYRMSMSMKQTNQTMMEKLVVRYFTSEYHKDFISKEEFGQLEDILEMEYREYYFHMIPVIIFILKDLKSYLTNEYI